MDKRLAENSLHCAQALW